jgi:uncharacterized membrane protein
MAAGIAETTWSEQLNRAVGWGLRHWLLFANGLVLLYGGLPWLSPLAKAAGYAWVGQFLFLLYTPLCHQIPARSFFVAGYQVAFCHREAAMYTSLFAGGLLFGLVRARVPPLSLRTAGLLLLPMLVDGSTHLLDDLFGLGIRGGGDTVGMLNFWLRLVTGVLFAIAVLLAVYPRLERDLRAEQLLVP